MQFIELLKKVPPDSVVIVFGIVIVVVFVVGVFIPGKHQGRDTLPTTLTTIGILGTFVGIAIGLSNFETSDSGAIDRSIPHLLEGLKSAFLTSIFGIFAALLFPLVRALLNMFNQFVTGSFSSRNRRYRESETVTPVDILNALTGIGDGQAAALEEHKAIRSGIAGDGDSSIVSQIQKLRSDQRDVTNQLRAEVQNVRKAISDKSEISLLSQMIQSRDEQRRGLHLLSQELNHFASELSKISSETMIKTLEDTIKRFNDELSQQLGDNFVKFNDAVGVLHHWQEMHKQQVEQLVVAFEQVQSGSRALADNVQQVKQDTAAIPDHMRLLGTIITTNQMQLQDLDRHLTAFGEAKESAVNAVPAIRDLIESSTSELTGRMNRYTETVESAVERSSTNIQKSSESMMQTVNETGKAMSDTATRTGDEMSKSFDNMASSFASAQTQSQQKMNDSMTEAFEGQARRIGELSDGLKSRMEVSIQQFQELSETRFDALDSGMQTALHDALQALAEALAGVTHKFAGDYGQVLESFRLKFEELDRNSRVSP